MYAISMGQPWSCLSNGVPTIGCIGLVLQNAVNGALIFLGAVGVIMIIFAGIKLLMAGGDSKKVDDARKTLIHAIVGIIIVLLAFTIVNFIATITGVSCINNPLDFSNTSNGCK